MPRLVLLHGFTQRGAIWAPVTQRLDRVLGEEWEIVTPDLPGHGNVPIPPGMDLWKSASELVREHGAAHWVGYSLGGRTLLHAALLHPHAVQSMVLVGARAGIEDAREAQLRQRNDENMASMLEHMDDVTFERWLEETWLATPMFAGLRADDRQVHLRLTNDPEQLAMSLRQHGIGKQDDLWPRLVSLTTPTTVVWGEHDALHVVDDCRRLTAVMPNARPHCVEGAGHSVPWEVPDAFTQIIIDSLT